MNQVPLGGPFRMMAEIFHGDVEQPERVWVCVRTTEPASAAWVGCWSKLPESQEDQGIESILRELAQIARTCVSTGPYGPVLTEHLFFTGWQAWGSGIPAPLKELQ